MSEYVIYNIKLVVTPHFDFEELVEIDKPVSVYPNYYLGKIIGETGKGLSLKRTRRGGKEEYVPNCVLRNDNGIALIRIHNKEEINIYELPKAPDDKVNGCTITPQKSYPYAYVVVDYRDGRCQLAIERTPSWDSKTVTIKNILEGFFYEKLENNIGITTKLDEKTIKTKYEDFIDQRTIDEGDVIESFTFEYVNIKKSPTVRIPKDLTEQMELHSKLLEIYDAIEGTTTWKLGKDPNTDKLKQLSSVVTMCSDNAFQLITHFRNYGDYICNESIVAKFPMNEIVISNFRDNVMPDVISSEYDLRSWLDDVFIKVKKGKNDEEIPAKSMH